MKILVTGATGHLGANLVRRLLADGHDVRALAQAKNPRDEIALDGLPLERVYGDLRDLDAMRAAARGVERVYHTAAKVSTLPGEERVIYDTNVVGTRNVLKAAREAGVQRVVVSGSLSAVGNNPDRPANEDDAFYPFEEHMPYARSKAWVEHECLKAVVLGQEVVVATSCAILGPNDFIPSRMGRVVRDYANGKMRAYLPGGFDFVAARDIVAGHVLAMEKGKVGQRYIFSTRFCEVDELMGILEKVTGRPPPPLRLPPLVMAGIARVSSFVLTNFFPQVPQRFTPAAVRLLQMRRRADTTRAQRELGYRPTSIEDAIREAYEHFVERGEIKEPRVPVRTARDRKNGIAENGTAVSPVTTIGAPS
jgi:3beta-hydroxysteroid-4beta-carboxylate 3-dehydrogenase (decarboxylating)